ncbi:hypothetical protein ACLOJK_027079 [Asimina triloba]
MKIADDVGGRISWSAARRWLLPRTARGREVDLAGSWPVLRWVSTHLHWSLADRAGSRTKMGFSWDLGKMEDGGQVLFGSTVGCWICHRICDGELGHAAGSVGYGRRSSMVQKGRAAGSGGDGSGPSAGG